MSSSSSSTLRKRTGSGLSARSFGVSEKPIVSQAMEALPQRNQNTKFFTFLEHLERLVPLHFRLFMRGLISFLCEPTCFPRKDPIKIRKRASPYLIGGKLVFETPKWANLEFCTLDRNNVASTLGENPRSKITLEFLNSPVLEFGFQKFERARLSAPLYMFASTFFELLVAFGILHMRHSVDFEVLKGAKLERHDNKPWMDQFESYLTLDYFTVYLFTATIPLAVRAVLSYEKFLKIFDAFYLSFLAFRMVTSSIWYALAAKNLWTNNTSYEDSFTFCVAFAYICAFSRLRWVYLIWSLVFLFFTFGIPAWFGLFNNPTLKHYTEHEGISLITTRKIFSQYFSGGFLITFSVVFTLTLAYNFESLCRTDHLLSQYLLLEGERSEGLLFSMFPKKIAKQLIGRDSINETNETSGNKNEKNQNNNSNFDLFSVSTVSPFWTNLGSNILNDSLVESYSAVSVIFVDIFNFAQFASQVAPTDLVETLNSLFTIFDNLLVEDVAEKIKTVGCAYMVAVGVPEVCKSHATLACETALRMVEEVEKSENLCFDLINYDPDLHSPLVTTHKVRVRVGVDSGSCVAGLIGRRRFIFDIWGDCVNTASRMMSHGSPGRVQITENTKMALERLKLSKISLFFFFFENIFCISNFAFFQKKTNFKCHNGRLLSFDAPI